MRKVPALAVVTVGIFLNAHSGSGQDLFKYREYALLSSLASVAQIADMPAADAKTLHERPAKIQELKWRAPYAAADAVGADPVRDLVFTFHDDQLYQVVVTYDRTRVEGLTNADLIESLSATYGAPMLTNGKLARAASPGTDLTSDAVVVARWDRAESSLMLMRGTYSPGLQLVLTSKSLSARARIAIAAAGRLDASEAPQRELDQQKQATAAAATAQAKARVQNKAAFKP